MNSPTVFFLVKGERRVCVNVTAEHGHRTLTSDGLTGFFGLLFKLRCEPTAGHDNTLLLVLHIMVQDFCSFAKIGVIGHGRMPIALSIFQLETCVLQLVIIVEHLLLGLTATLQALVELFDRLFRCHLLTEKLTALGLPRSKEPAHARAVNPLGVEFVVEPFNRVFVPVVKQLGLVRGSQSGELRICFNVFPWAHGFCGLRMP